MRISKTLISTVASAALLLILAAPKAMAILPNDYTCTGHANGAAVTGTSHSDITNPSAPGGGGNCVANSGSETLSLVNKAVNKFVGIVDRSGSQPGKCVYATDFLKAAGYNLGPDGSEGGEGFWYYTSGPWQGCVMGVQFSAYGKTGTFNGFLYVHSSPLLNPPQSFVNELIKNKIISFKKGVQPPTCTAAGNVGDLGCYGASKLPKLPF